MQQRQPGSHVRRQVGDAVGVKEVASPKVKEVKVVSYIVEMER